MPAIPNKPITPSTPLPAERAASLTRARSLKMARSAHAYVRGNTQRFYEWLEDTAASTVPQGPAVWICGDCHVGNLGPVASSEGDVEIQIRDFDQTVIGNPAHDLIRLGLSLAMAARSSDLPGVTTARMMEQLMLGYHSAFEGPSRSTRDQTRPGSVQVALKQAQRRTWRHLAEERVNGKTVRLPLGCRFWQVSDQELRDIEAMFETKELKELATLLRRRPTDAPVQVLDAAYWMKGCSSLGKLRFAAMLDVGGRASKGRDLCLVDIKEAVTALAPRYSNADMPRENAHRVVAGARQLSPHLGERMAATRLGEHSVFVRELLPQDLKLEIEGLQPQEAKRAARYLAQVVGRAHARQLDDLARTRWRKELKRTESKGLEAPSWLWNSVVELVGNHERGYLDHCRRYALERDDDRPAQIARAAKL